MDEPTPRSLTPVRPTISAKIKVLTPFPALRVISKPTSSRSATSSLCDEYELWVAVGVLQLESRTRIFPEKAFERLFKDLLGFR